ncbi:MAG: aminotransferase class I/II-fold pyridoxal phosphate-dependent enzyme [Emergencia sp.]|nr:aminotransferase class I/II-fold pyridoxal phosphate-dependent enzyme [Emergencia sp.]
MTEYIAALQNGRNVPKEDKIFGISSRAKAMAAEKGDEAVVNATIGTLLDDEGNLMVLSSVAETFSALTAEEYASYAPIGGIPSYKEAVIRAALGSYQPKGYVEVCATPGGTGAIRNTIANYSAPGDKVLIGDWHWSPYGTIASEIGRKIETFTMFTEEGTFNTDAFCKKTDDILKEQSHLVIILNTPAHNPTGYALSDEEWRRITEYLSGLSGGKTVALLIDAAYIDFAGDEEKYRSFLPITENLPANVLPIIAYSMSKTFTLYGMRTGAALCIAKTKEIAEEFRRVFEFSSRGSWSNCAKAGQSIIARIYEDEALLSKVTEERKEIRDMLLARGKAFEEAAGKVGLEIVPFDAGFFVSIPCENPDEISRRLEKEGIFLVPLAKGLRVSVASVSEKVCGMLPEKILAAMK